MEYPEDKYDEEMEDLFTFQTPLEREDFEDIAKFINAIREELNDKEMYTYEEYLKEFEELQLHKQK